MAAAGAAGVAAFDTLGCAKLRQRRGGSEAEAASHSSPVAGSRRREPGGASSSSHVIAYGITCAIHTSSSPPLSCAIDSRLPSSSSETARARSGAPHRWWVPGDHGDVACDHYNNLEGDVRRMSEMGLASYRFSISWPRVMPDGMPASESAAGVAFYRKLREARPGYPARFLLFDTGKHGSPIRMIDWRDTLNWIASK